MTAAPATFGGRGIERAFLGLLCLLAGCQSALAQHETGADVFSGEQAFQNYCANCHGRAGNQIAGVDLGHGIFRKAYDDAELTHIVMQGIPGTPMPATPSLSREQAVQIVAWLRSRAASKDAGAGGDAQRGRALFAGKGECFACHRIDGAGSSRGPDLSGIGRLRSSGQLAVSLLDPDREVQPVDRSYSVMTGAGERIGGRLLNRDAYSVQLLEDNGQLRSLMKADLTSERFVPSPMPSLRGTFDEQELADLVQYLVSLRGAGKP